MRHFSSRSARGFTLVEIMVVIAIISLLASIAVPNFIRARKRSQATLMLDSLRAIDSAVDQYAIETTKSPGAAANWTDLRAYLKPGSHIYNSAGFDLFGTTFDGFTVDAAPKLRASSFAKLSDVAPSDFWSPFYP